MSVRLSVPAISGSRLAAWLKFAVCSNEPNAKFTSWNWPSSYFSFRVIFNMEVYESQPSGPCWWKTLLRKVLVPIRFCSSSQNEAIRVLIFVIGVKSSEL